MLSLAHAGHWLTYILYAVPVLIVLGSILATVIRDRRDRTAAEPRPPAS